MIKYVITECESCGLNVYSLPGEHRRICSGCRMDRAMQLAWWRLAGDRFRRAS